MFEIVALPAGGYSLRSQKHAETFHPGIGPVEEARILHVEQQKLLARSLRPERFVLWDVGLGAAANAVAALETLTGSKSMVEIHSFDISLAPLEFALANTDTLTYLAPHADTVRTLVREGEVQITKKLRWIFHLGDFRETLHRKIPSPQGIFYDPYSLNTNREMWTLPHFTQLRVQLGPDCLLTNYTRSTAVRVTLLLAGFYVGIGIGIGDKSETTIASTSFDSLERPLPRSWLERVRVSGNSAPFHQAEFSIAPIGESDFARLLKHPQFS